MPGEVERFASKRTVLETDRFCKGSFLGPNLENFRLVHEGEKNIGPELFSFVDGRFQKAVPQVFKVSEVST